MKKQKKYVLIVSKYFPNYHHKKGQPTYFVEKIKTTFEQEWDIESTGAVFPDRYDYKPKLHTIRGNYELWKKRVEAVQRGEAVIVLRYWAGKPYKKDSNGVGQIEFATLDKDSGIGIQELKFYNSNFLEPIIPGTFENFVPKLEILAQNDGLSFDDFEEWFKPYDLSKSMAIIQFINFKYVFFGCS